MDDFVPLLSASIALIAMLYFLLEFQFAGAGNWLAARLRSLKSRGR